MCESIPLFQPQNCAHTPHLSRTGGLQATVAESLGVRHCQSYGSELGSPVCERSVWPYGLGKKPVPRDGLQDRPVFAAAQRKPGGVGSRASVRQQ